MRRHVEGAGVQEQRRGIVDVLVGLGLAALLLLAGPGLGVLAWFALPLLVVLLLTFAGQRLHRRRADGQLSSGRGGSGVSAERGEPRN